jgi:hypothetical protein
MRTIKATLLLLLLVFLTAPVLIGQDEDEQQDVEPICVYAVLLEEAEAVNNWSSRAQIQLSNSAPTFGDIVEDENYEIHNSDGSNKTDVPGVLTRGTYERTIGSTKVIITLKEWSDTGKELQSIEFKMEFEDTHCGGPRFSSPKRDRVSSEEITHAVSDDEVISIRISVATFLLDPTNDLEIADP